MAIGITVMSQQGNGVLPNNNRIVNSGIYMLHVPGCENQYADHLKDHFTILVFFGNNPTIPIKGGIGELSNKAVTDFEIAKTLLDFPSFLLM
jgi:hypothetical protein